MKTKQFIILACLLMVAQVMAYAVETTDRGAELELISEQYKQADNNLKLIIDSFAEGLENPIETIIGSFTMEGTDIPTGLSRYLSERVTYHAMNNPDGKYIVIENSLETDYSQVAVLSGFFLQREKMIDVALELTTPDGIIDNTHIFSISLDFLTDVIQVAVTPENLENKAELDTILEVVGIETANVTTNNGINIRAVFNSESRTYLHRDELKMSLMSDTDCYFKVIHIDVNNQLKMIYPNFYDKDNHLKTNTARDIFETASYMLYEPYGVETIIIIASTEQFANIEREYITPWTAATIASVSDVTGRNRGGDLENRILPNALEGEVSYTITILRPHEEYEYERPENMKAFIENIRNETINQGGTFEGNETSGLYVINGIRGSYRIPREAPDTIRFAYYYLDNYISGEDTGIQTSGNGFNFSFASPINILQLINEVKTNIEEKGGTLSNNELQGIFMVSGIAGQYSISDIVNVTITEKPHMLPNSFIIREVKSFFGYR